MQQQLPRATLGSSQRLCTRLLPSVLRRGLRPRQHRQSPNAAGTPEAVKPSTSGTNGTLELDPLTVVEASVVEPGSPHAEDDDSRASTLEDAWKDAVFPEVPVSIARAAGWQYAAVGALYAVAGGAVAVAALRSPHSLFPAAASAAAAASTSTSTTAAFASASAADPWVVTLLGCLASTYVCAAGVFLHLKGAADRGELLSWRHQRLAAAAALYGSLAAASQLLAPASLPLAGLQALLAAATAAVVVGAGRAAWAVRPFVSAMTDLGRGGRIAVSPELLLALEAGDTTTSTTSATSAGMLREAPSTSPSSSSSSFTAAADAAASSSPGLVSEAVAAASHPQSDEQQRPQQALSTAAGAAAGLGPGSSAAAAAAAVLPPGSSSSGVQVELQPGGLLSELWQAAVQPFGTVAGLLLLGVAALSLYGFFSTALAPAPLPPNPLGAWPTGRPPSLGSAHAGLRRLVGSGLLLTAAAAHGLMDFAATVREPPAAEDLEAVKRVLLMQLMRTRDRLAKYYLPDPASFKLLNLALIAAALLQAFFVVRAPGLGVDVNWDGALWGPLYGTWMLVLSYGLVALTSFDWGTLLDLVLLPLVLAAGGVLAFFNAFVWKFDWAEKTRRK